MTRRGSRTFHKVLLLLEGFLEVLPESGGVAVGFSSFLRQELRISTVGVEGFLEEGSFVGVEV
jgi:hypothetical protein